MKKFLSLFLLLLSAFSLRAQLLPISGQGDDTFAKRLNDIWQNNQQIQTAEERLKAARLTNKADVSLPDPEAEVAYLLGSPKNVPNRTNVSVTQTLDWGILTGKKREWTKAKDKVAATEYFTTVREVMSETLPALVSAVYYNRLCRELTRREQSAVEIERMYEKKFSDGDVSRIELNKVRLNARVSRSERTRAESERTAVFASLARLNGGQTVEMPDTVYPTFLAHLSNYKELEEEVLKSYSVQTAEEEIKLSQAAEKVARLERLPQLTVGFQGEYIRQNNYSGLSLGFTLPLWQGSRRKAKAAEAETVVRTLEAESVRQQQISSLRENYDLARSLAEGADHLREGLSQTANDHLLRRSLEEGQISLLDYLLEQSFYYTAQTALLEAERDAAHAAARLWLLRL